MPKSLSSPKPSCGCLQDADARAAMGRAAYSVFEGSQGATQFTVDHIAAIFEEQLAK